MLSRLLDAITGSDALTRASRRTNRRTFAELFGHSLVWFLNVPPGMHGGLDPNITQEEFLAHIRAAAKDLKDREIFTPFCRSQGDRTALLVFTQSAFAEQFAKAYVRDVQRIMSFEALQTEGTVLVQKLGDIGADTIVLNPRTKHEYELTDADTALLRELWFRLPQAAKTN
jgi:hypothetical protein